MKGLCISSLHAVLDSVKTLFISQTCFNLDEIVDLLRCFQCLQNLFIEVMISHTLKAHAQYT